MSDLFDASNKGDLVRVQDLIGEGADVNNADSGGVTSLLYASSKGHLEEA